MSTETALVAFGAYRCHCTMVAVTLGEIADLCPTHNTGLLGPASWEVNPNNVPLGLESRK